MKKRGTGRNLCAKKLNQGLRPFNAKVQNLNAMTKFDLEKLREIAQPPKEHRPRMTPDELAELKQKIRERAKQKRESSYKEDK